VDQQALGLGPLSSRARIKRVVLSKIVATSAPFGPWVLPGESCRRKDFGNRAGEKPTVRNALTDGYELFNEEFLKGDTLTDAFGIE
jgi:hypothetical protein